MIPVLMVLSASVAAPSLAAAAFLGVWAVRSDNPSEVQGAILLMWVLGFPGAIAACAALGFGLLWGLS